MIAIIRIIKKYKKVLSEHQKKRIVQLAIIMLIGGMVEMLSVSLMIPFINSVMNPEEMMNNRYVKFLCNLFHLKSATIFLVAVALLLALIYILKNIYLLIQTKVQLKFVYNNMFATQKELFKNYLSRPYEYYLGINSSEVLRVIVSDTREAFILLTSLLGLFSEIIVSSVLIITIFVIAPGLTVGIGILLVIIVSIILKVLRPVLRRCAITNQTSFSQMNQWVLQAIQGIKELKIAKKEGFFVNNFSASGQAFVVSSYRSQTYCLIPRFMIEAITMGVFFILVALLIYIGTPLETLIPMLSAVAMAAIRLLPAANRISQSMADISYREPMLDKMMENLNDMSKYKINGTVKEGAAEIKPLSRVIEFMNISYKYPEGNRNVLDNASMTIQKGQSIGIIGTSGAGKTTAIDVLLGLLKPSDGKVLIDGTDIILDMDGWLSQVSYIPQSIFMLNGTIRQNVAFGLKDDEIEDKKVWAALKEAALDDFVRSLPTGLETQLGERGIRVSGGQRQRIGIARALYTNPSVLFFDESTSALDNDTEKAIMDSINNLKNSKTIIIIAHRLTTIENCNQVYEVEDGKITRVDIKHHNRN